MSQSRLQNGAIDYLSGGRWRLWLHTVDWQHGTFLEMHPDGAVFRVTVYKDRDDDDIVEIAPPYKEKADDGPNA